VPDDVRLHAFVSGYVQGVGFRYWVREQAQRLGVAGSVRNLPDGRVEIAAEGARPDCESLLAAVRGASAPGSVRDVDASWAEPQGMSGFRAF
jgi:acylphosphatase